jgi:hypothetical protein
VHNYDYANELVRKYARDSPWPTVRLLLLGCAANHNAKKTTNVEKNSNANSNSDANAADETQQQPTISPPSSNTGVASSQRSIAQSKTATTYIPPFQIDSVSLLHALPSEILRRIAWHVIATFHPVVLHQKKLTELRKRLICDCHEHPMKFLVCAPSFDQR